MKILSKVKNNMLGFIIGGIIFGSIGITIASQILATQVSYTNEDSPSNVTNVRAALTELYALAEECQESSSSGSAVEYKGPTVDIVYLDPTNLSTTCSSAASSNTGINSGCMRFYVYAEDGEYKYAILDHNTTAKVSSCTNDNCFAKAQSQVKEDTSSWDPNLQARNISAMEVYKITESTNKQTNWQINGGTWFYFNAKNGNNGQGYGWLFDRTKGCTSGGCTTQDSSTSGYWTSDTHSRYIARFVKYDGSLDTNYLYYSEYGVRPVIQISKIK